MQGEVACRLSQTGGRQPLEVVPRGRSLLYIGLAVGQILRPGEAGRFLRRWQRRHAAVQVGCSTNDRHGGSRRRGRAGGSMAEVVDPSIVLADYQAKVERLIPASERGPGLTFLMLLLPVATEINQSFCLWL